MKQLLTAEELILHMEGKGIAFTIDDKEQAKDFLENHNYYMKLAHIVLITKNIAAVQKMGNISI